MLIGSFIGSVVGGIISEVRGRKFSMLLDTSLCLAGVLLMAFSTKVWHLLLGRLLTGYCFGSLQSAIPVYTSETTQPSMRKIAGGIEYFCLFNYISWLKFPFNRAFCHNPFFYYTQASLFMALHLIYGTDAIYDFSHTINSSHLVHSYPPQFSRSTHHSSIAPPVLAHKIVAIDHAQFCMIVLISTYQAPSDHFHALGY